MWKCKACGSEVEDDSWDVCWRCSTDRSASGPALAERQKAISKKIAPATSIQCLRCHRTMEYGGTKRFHEGGSAIELWLGPLFVNRELYDVYACPQCGKIEFFIDGIGDELRGEK